MATDDTTIEEITIPYPEQSPARLEINVSAPGNISISAGETEDFVTGTIDCNKKDWKPEIWQKDDSVRIMQAPGVEKIAALFSIDARNKWNLKIGNKKPFSLEVKIGICQGEWNLGGLPVTALKMQTGVGKNTIMFDKPNPEVLETCQFDAGAGDIEVRDLLNANFKKLVLKGGVGSMRMNFSGEKLLRNAQVIVTGGVGHFGIMIDKNVPAQIRTAGVVGVSAGSSFERRSGMPVLMGSYVTATFDDAAEPKLEFDVTVGVGLITLDTK